MNKYIKTITVSAIFASFLIMTPIFAKAEIASMDDVVTTTASNGNDDVNTSSGDTTTNGGDDNVISTPVLINGGDDVNQNPVTSPVIPPTAETPANTGGGSTGGSNGGSSGGSSNGRSTNTGSGSVLPILTNIGNCSYINTYMKFGIDNNSAEVTKLQTFLKNVEKLNVDITGIFDQKTMDAVKAFQTKYVKDTMLPWGVTTPSGQVYFTTKNKINEIYCKSTFSLTALQLSAIEAYKKGITNDAEVVVTDGAVINAPGSIPLVGDTDTNTTNDSSLTASVGGTSIFSWLWTKIKWLFGY